MMTINKVARASTKPGQMCILRSARLDRLAMTDRAVSRAGSGNDAGKQF